MDIMCENKQIPMIECFTTSSLMDIPHIHKEMEMIYVYSGQTTATVGNDDCTMTAGDLLVVRPYQTHTYPSSRPGSHNRFLVLIFPTHSLAEMEQQFMAYDPISPVIPVQPNSLTDQCFRAMAAVRGSYAHTKICAYLTLAISDLIPTISWKIREPMDHTVENILQYCSRHFTENVTLDVMAADLHLSKYYISHTINKYTKMNLNTIINSFRIELACRLLHQTDHKITHIAQDVGYDSLRSFNRAFMALNQTTPLAYRKKFRGAP